MSASPTDPLALRPTDYFSSGDGRVGEFTPPLGDDEVEILCIRLRSSMGEVISVRAHRSDVISLIDENKPPILYEVVDEYADEYDPGIEISDEPLTGYEVIELLRGIPSGTENFPHFHHFFESMASFDEPKRRTSPESVAAGQGFVSLQSDFYPDLNPALAEWYREYLEEHASQSDS